MSESHARNQLENTSTRMVAYDQISVASPLKAFYHAPVVWEMVAETGGEFQMSPNTRTDTDQNYDHVADVLHGERDDTIVSVGREPGALCIFRSCNSPHRTMRIMGVFVYEREPGVLGDPEVNETIYGQRVAAN